MLRLQTAGRLPYTGSLGSAVNPGTMAVTLSLIKSDLFTVVFISSTLGEKDRAVMYVKECTAYVFLEEFDGFWLSFKSLIHFEFILCMVLRRVLVSSFYL